MCQLVDSTASCVFETNVIFYKINWAFNEQKFSWVSFKCEVNVSQEAHSQAIPTKVEFVMLYEDF